MNSYVNELEKVFIEVECDDMADSPREWSNLWQLFTFERGYNSPDKHDYHNLDELLYDYLDNDEAINRIEANSHNANDHFSAMAEEFNKIGYFIAPINRYEHGSVRYSRSLTSGWDYGIVGVAIVSHSDVIKEYGSLDQFKALNVLDGELKNYTDWANGEVYKLSVVSFDGDYLDSLSGMFGYESYEAMVKEFIDGCTPYDSKDFELKILRTKTTYYV